MHVHLVRATTAPSLLPLSSAAFRGEGWGGVSGDQPARRLTLAGVNMLQSVNLTVIGYCARRQDSLKRLSF
jgi:hypothetical protein